MGFPCFHLVDQVRFWVWVAIETIRILGLRSTLIQIYKNKWDIQNYTNYHEIKLISHINETLEKIY